MPLNSGISQTGSVTTTNANDLVVGAIAINVAGTITVSSGGFTLVSEATSGTPDTCLLERIVSSTGSYNAAISMSPAWLAFNGAGAVLALKSATASFAPRTSSTLLTF